MPKEVIRDQFVHEGDDKNPALPLQIEIGWQREHMDVQIGTVNPKYTAEFTSQHGWFVHLDREAVNRLIRTLRKARDQAFGADA